MRRAEKLYGITGLPWGYYDLVEDMDEEEALDLRITPELNEHIESMLQGLLDEITGMLDGISQQLQDLADVIDKQGERIGEPV